MRRYPVTTGVKRLWYTNRQKLPDSIFLLSASEDICRISVGLGTKPVAESHMGYAFSNCESIVISGWMHVSDVCYSNHNGSPFCSGCIVTIEAPV